MKTANIATVKNQLSRMIGEVKRGERILITDRNHPVARLEPVGDAAPVLKRLQAAGVLSAPVGASLNVGAFLAGHRPRLLSKQSLTGAVLAEREEGR